MAGKDIDELSRMIGMGTGVNAAEVHRSTDGATWTRTYTESFADFGDIAWCATDSQFIIVGPQETSPYIYIKTSPDCTASSFTNRTAASGESAAPNFINVTYDNSTDEYCIAASGVSGGGGD